jgi:hypothetical protein
MRSVRREVHNFLVAAEKLLSPIRRDPELTPEECHLICEYRIIMSRDNHPWSSHLASMMSGPLRRLRASPALKRFNAVIYILYSAS